MTKVTPRDSIGIRSVFVAGSSSYVAENRLLNCYSFFERCEAVAADAETREIQPMAATEGMKGELGARAHAGD